MDWRQQTEELPQNQAHEVLEHAIDLCTFEQLERVLVYVPKQTRRRLCELWDVGPRESDA